jgi:transcriptional antiterminator
LLVELSLLGLLVFIDIDDFKLLSDFIVSFVAYLDVSVFSISVKVLVLNLKYLTLLVDNETTFSFPDLPPS